MSVPGRWLLAAILFTCLGLRVSRLDAIPVAGDESIYLRWAEIILHQKQWSISLLDGKQPLSYWLYAVARLLWSNDPLVAARLVSATAGVLSALGVFAIGRRLAGEGAGLAAALGYTFFPYALLYDRLAYAESLVNLAGVAIVYTSMAFFDDANRSWRRALVPGLALGLGFFVKSTAILFWFFPLSALALKRGERRSLWSSLGVIYLVALLFPLLSWAMTPSAPTAQTHSVVLHQTSFFVSPQEFLRNPLAVAPSNIRLLGEYAGAYATAPLALATVAAVLYLIRKRSAAAIAVFSASLLPLLVQVFTLQKIFPSRYPYPHLWPWFVVIAVAAAGLPWPKRRLWSAAGAAILAVSVMGAAAVKAVCILRTPRSCLYVEDAQTFLGSGPAAGFGVREAAEFLLTEARKDPLVVFTDPIWGSPADAMFAYLNERAGIRVYEAWWMTIAPNYPILPPSPIELVKSHYERVPYGMLDPSSLRRVFYVTENQYTPAGAVKWRQPSAERVASFPKPNGRNSIDVYRLR